MENYGLLLLSFLMKSQIQKGIKKIVQQTEIAAVKFLC